MKAASDAPYEHPKTAALQSLGREVLARNVEALGFGYKPFRKAGEAILPEEERVDRNMASRMVLELPAMAAQWQAFGPLGAAASRGVQYFGGMGKLVSKLPGANRVLERMAESAIPAARRIAGRLENVPDAAARLFGIGAAPPGTIGERITRGTLTAATAPVFEAAVGILPGRTPPIPTKKGTFGDFVKARGGIKNGDLKSIAEEARKEGYPLEDATPSEVRRLYREDAALRKANQRGVTPEEAIPVEEVASPPAPVAPTQPVQEELKATAPKAEITFEIGKPQTQKTARQGGTDISVTQTIRASNGMEFELYAHNTPDGFKANKAPGAKEPVWRVEKLGGYDEAGTRTREVVKEGVTKKEAMEFLEAERAKHNEALVQPVVPPTAQEFGSPVGRAPESWNNNWVKKIRDLGGGVSEYKHKDGRTVYGMQTSSPSLIKEVVPRAPRGQTPTASGPTPAVLEGPKAGPPEMAKLPAPPTAGGPVGPPPAQETIKFAPREPAHDPNPMLRSRNNGSKPIREFFSSLPHKTQRLWDDVVQYWFDDTQPITRMMLTVGSEPSNVLENPREMIKYLRGVDSTIAHEIEYNLMPRLKPIAKNYEAFEEYALVKRAIEKQRWTNAKLQGTKDWTGKEAAGRPIEELQALADETARKYPEFEAVRRKLVEFNHEALKVQRDAGLISQKDYKAILKENQEYVPFHRGEQVKGFGKAPWYKRGTGTAEDIQDVILASTKNYIATMRMAYLNRAADTFAKYVEGHSAARRFAHPITPKNKPLKFSAEQIVDQLEAMGADVSGIDRNTPFQIWVGGNRPKDTWVRWKDGKPEYWMATEEGKGLLNVFTNPFSSLSTLEKRVNFFGGAARTAARLLRLGATGLNPEFTYRNVLRDIQTRWIQSGAQFRDRPGMSRFNPFGRDNDLKRLTMRPFIDLVDIPRALAASAGKTKLWREWMKGGGGYHSMVTMDRKGFDQLLNRMVRRLPNTFDPRHPIESLPGFRNLPYRARHPIEFSREVIGHFENATRIAEYRRALSNAIRAGVPEEEAIARAVRASQEVTLNFRTAGLYGRVANRYLPFFNAQMQDLNKMAEMFKRDPTGTSIKVMTYGVLPSLAIRKAIREDPELNEAYERTPEWKKRVFYGLGKKWFRDLGMGWFVDGIESTDKIMGKSSPAEVNDPFIWFVGRPFGYGYPGYATEKFMDFWRQEDPEGFEKATAGLIKQYTPSISNPLTDLAFLYLPPEGFSTFRGSDVLTQRDMGVRPMHQYGQTTPTLAVQLGKKVDEVTAKMEEGKVGKYLPSLPRLIEKFLGSPKKTAEAIGIIGGGGLRLLVDAVTRGMEGAGLVDPTDQFMTPKSLSGQDSDEIQKFFKMSKLGQTAQGSINRLEEEDRDKEAEEFESVRRNKALLELHRIYNKDPLPKGVGSRMMQKITKPAYRELGELLKEHDRLLKAGDPEAKEYAKRINELARETNQKALEAYRAALRGE